VKLTWGDAVYTDAVFSPLRAERLAKHDNTGLGSVVARLLLWVVDNGSGHRCNQDDGSGLASSNHGLADCLRNEEGAGQVDVDKTTEHDWVVRLSGDVRTEIIRPIFNKKG